MKVQLKVIGGSKEGQVVSINAPKFLIGRADDCQLKPRSDLISRYHCVIISENGYVGIRDLGSKNGVYHNGKRVVIEEEIKNGDRILIGPLEFEVILTVALKGESKPKVESIQEVVARAVEQGASAGIKAHESGDASHAESHDQDNKEFSSWLMHPDEDNDSDTQSYATGMEDDVLADLPYAKQQTEEEPPAESESDKQNKPATPNTSDAAANLLKNFFKGGR